CGVALQPADLHRLAFRRLAHASLLAQRLGRADAGAHAAEDVLVEDGARRAERIAGRDLADEQRDVDRGRARLHARRVVAEIAAVGLHRRLMPVERRVQVGKVVGILRRGKPAGGEALSVVATVLALMLAPILALRHGVIPHYDFGKMLARSCFLSIGQKITQAFDFSRKKHDKSTHVIASRRSRRRLPLPAPPVDKTAPALLILRAGTAAISENAMTMRAAHFLSVFLVALAVLTAPAAAQERTVVRTPDADSYGFGLRFETDVPLDACEAVCLADNECRAFTYTPRAQRCFLKSDYGAINPFAGAIAGRVVTTVDEPDLGAPPALSYVPD